MFRYFGWIRRTCTWNGGVWNAADYPFGSLACWRPRASGAAYASVCYSCPRIRDACVSAGIRPRPVLARALSDQSNQGTVNRARRLVLQQRGSFPFVVFDIMQSNLICYSLMLLLVHIRPGTSLLGPVSDDIIGADLCML
jgi:hypothetical protein